MSFNNFSSDLESGAVDARSIHYQDYPEFEDLTHKIESLLSTVNNTQLVSIRNVLKQYETVSDSDDVTNDVLSNNLSNNLLSNIDKTTNTYKEITDLTKKVNEYLKTCEANHEDDDTMKYLRQKESLVIKLIKNSLKQFQVLQKKSEAIQQKTISQIHASQELTQQGGQDTSPSLQQQQQQQAVQINYEAVNAEELEQQTLLIQEREREIEQISQDITYINEIYGNLEDIVHEQQFAIDSIEDNILKYSTDVHGASDELRRAERYQRRSSGRMLCCFIILAVVLGFIILVGVIF